MGAGTPEVKMPRRGAIRSVGAGLITGAADADPSAIGTYASAGAAFGPGLLWAVPVMLPMMFTVVYLSGKLGQVAGQGLFAVLRKHATPWLLYPTLAAALIGNTIEAGADLGGVAAAIRVVLPVPAGAIVIVTAAGIVALQIAGSYGLLRNVLRILALTLLAYVPAAILARPDWPSILKATLVPSVHPDRAFLSMLVAIIGTTLSAYLYTWQSNEEVEDEIALGRTCLRDRKGATEQELRHARRDIVAGMLFSNVAMYFIMLATASMRQQTGTTAIASAADVALALRPVAGHGAGLLFALGVAGAGLLAVPVMTSGAAYDLCQTVGWEYGLSRKPAEAKRFYLATALFTLLAAAMNFLGVDPIRALIIAAIVQGFSTPPLMLLILLMTNNRKIMGNRTNGWAINTLGAVTTLALFAASLGLLATWFF
jgi:Mn2+/Fe2+ NRAMP family transporter